MRASHQKNVVDREFPFNLLITDIAEFPPHWHKEIELIYVLEGLLDVGLNNKVYTLEPGDILLVGMGDVHYFLTRPVKSKRIIIQFDLLMVEHQSGVFLDRRFKFPLIKKNRADSLGIGYPEKRIHRLLEEEILTLHHEYQEKAEGYKLAVMAGLYNLVALFIRHLPLEKVSPLEQNKQLKKLERLDQVFQFVEKNYYKQLTLDEVAKVASFSVYHFTRFFKETTGMTFLQYLNNYRISRAVKYLAKTNDSITEIAFQSGFGSIKSFNRVFKEIKGVAPTQYRKAISEK